MKTETIKTPTWEELVTMKETILADWFDDGVRCLIMRGPSSLCAYLGVPSDHPLAGFDYVNLPLSCHGGLTFSGEGEKGFRPVGFYWYGWDYAHLGDYSFYYDTPSLAKFKLEHSKDTKWTVELVQADMWEAIYEFKLLMNLAEKIKVSL